MNAATNFMNAAKTAIDGLGKLNAALQTDNAAMFEALKTIRLEIETHHAHVDRPADHTEAMLKRVAAAVRLALSRNGGKQ